jgi:hypothetical protein
VELCDVVVVKHGRRARHLEVHTQLFVNIALVAAREGKRTGVLVELGGFRVVHGQVNHGDVVGNRGGAGVGDADRVAVGLLLRRQQVEADGLVALDDVVELGCRGERNRGLTDTDSRAIDIAAGGQIDGAEIGGRRVAAPLQ